MGNKLDLDTKINYTTSQGQRIQLTMRDLKGYDNFPKLPSKEKDITSKFKNWLDDVIYD